jgi:anti-sigma-K factor RskA
VNIKEYILSGILEAYVLGDLSDAERSDVERNLEKYPELKSELTAIEEAQEQFLMSASLTPRAEVRNALFDAIESRDRKKVVSINRSSNSNFWKLAAAASISLAVISSYLAYNYYSNWKKSESALSGLIAQNQRMAQDYNQVNQRLDNMENDLKVMDNPNFQRILMRGTPNSPDAMASVYWNEASKEVYLKIQNMKTLSQENQYQLWAIIDGKPVDAGVFDGNVAGMVKMKEIGKGAVTFAVTIEPKGGKSSPTLETMQVAGNVTKG